MVRTQIQLTEEQSKALKRLAASRQLSIAELIRQAVDGLIKSGPSESMEERRRRAVGMAGKFGSGRRDISKEHDKYLGEDFGR